MSKRGQPTPEEIRLQLQAILASPAFLGSKRCHQFLEYVCDKSLSGEVGALKERTLAIEIFGRPPGSDLAEDTIVRVSAREVRKRLAQYYVTPEGSEAEIRIDLPPGAYAPEFRYHHPHHEPVAEALPATIPAMEAPPAIRRLRVRLPVAITVGVLILVIVAASVT